MSLSSRDLSFLENVLVQMEAGRRVIPVQGDPHLLRGESPQDRGPFRKKPLIENPYGNATTRPSTFRRWLRRWPDMNYGIVGGKASGSIILDADLDLPASPDQGWTISAEKTYHWMLEDLGLNIDLDRHLITHTPSGGLHIYFAFPEAYSDAAFPGSSVSHRNLGRGMDLKFAGGWAMGPGSSWLGHEYVCDDLEAELPEPSEAFIEYIRLGAPTAEGRRARNRSRGPVRAQTQPKPHQSKRSGSINPGWVHNALFGKNGEVTKLHALSAERGGRDSGVFTAARAIGGIILADGSGYTRDEGFTMYMEAAGHTIGDDWSYEDIVQKWARAVGGEDSFGRHWEPEAEVRIIPARRSR